MIEQSKNQQDILNTSAISRRKDARFATSIDSESIVMQKHWEQFAQIKLANNCVIIGQIVNISASGIAFQTAYHFDIFEPITVELALAYKQANNSVFAFNTFTVNAELVRSTEINSSFSFVAARILECSKDDHKKLKALIANISQDHSTQ